MIKLCGDFNTYIGCTSWNILHVNEMEKGGSEKRTCLKWHMNVINYGFTLYTSLPPTAEMEEEVLRMLDYLEHRLAVHSAVTALTKIVLFLLMTALAFGLYRTRDYKDWSSLDQVYLQ